MLFLDAKGTIESECNCTFEFRGKAYTEKFFRIHGRALITAQSYQDALKASNMAVASGDTIDWSKKLGSEVLAPHNDCLRPGILESFDRHNGRCNVRLKGSVADRSHDMDEKTNGTEVLEVSAHVLELPQDADSLLARETEYRQKSQDAVWTASRNGTSVTIPQIRWHPNSDRLEVGHAGRQEEYFVAFFYSYDGKTRHTFANGVTLQTGDILAFKSSECTRISRQQGGTGHSAVWFLMTGEKRNGREFCAGFSLVEGVVNPRSGTYNGNEDLAMKGTKLGNFQTKEYVRMFVELMYSRQVRGGVCTINDLEEEKVRRFITPEKAFLKSARGQAILGRVRWFRDTPRQIPLKMILSRQERTMIHNLVSRYHPMWTHQEGRLPKWLSSRPEYASKYEDGLPLMQDWKIVVICKHFHGFELDHRFEGVITQQLKESDIFDGVSHERRGKNVDGWSKARGTGCVAYGQITSQEVKKLGFRSKMKVHQRFLEPLGNPQVGTKVWFKFGGDRMVRKGCPPHPVEIGIL